MKILAKCKECDWTLELNINDFDAEKPRVISCPRCGSETQLRALEDVKRPKHREASQNIPATEAQIQYIRGLGGSPQPGITRAEASALVAELSGRVSPKQIAFLTYLGVHGPENLTREEASQRIEQLIESTDPTICEKRRDWSTDRILLYPDLYRDEVNHMLEEELPELLHGYVRARVIGSTEKLTRRKIRQVITSLTAESPLWWQAKNKGEVFFQRLSTTFPGCVDGHAPDKPAKPHLPEPTMPPTSRGTGCIIAAFLLFWTVLLVWKVLAR